MPKLFLQWACECLKDNGLVHTNIVIMGSILLIPLHSFSPGGRDLAATSVHAVS